MPSHAISPLRLIKHQVIEDFKAANLPRPLYQAWFEEQADRHDVKPTEIKYLVTEYMDQMDFMVQEQMASRSQKIAQSLGASLTAAVKVYVDGLSATKVQMVTSEDSDGNRVSEPFESPDNEIRHKSATKIIEIHGGFAPVETKQIVQHELDSLTEGELARLITKGLLESRSSATSDQATSLPAQPLIEPPSGPTEIQSTAPELPRSAPPRSPAPRTNGKVVNRRPVLLDDIGDQDKGRAAGHRSGPVPTVPKKKVYSRMPQARP